MSGRVRRKSRKLLEAEETEDSHTRENGTSDQKPTKSPKKKKCTKADTTEDIKPAVKKPRLPAESTEPVGPVKKCERASCQSVAAMCFAQASDRCAVKGNTSRWYHLSQGEHFCNDCFDHFYRSHKQGYEHYAQWKRTWAANGKTEASLRTYVADQWLPYWLECRKCGKWREVDNRCKLTTELVKEYYCGINKNGSRDSGITCKTPEDERILQTQQFEWISSVTNPPYLQHSPALPFVSDYYPDGIGMTASDTTRVKQDITDGYFNPFSHPDEPPSARCWRPDVMDEEEEEKFQEYAGAPQMYLALRNAAISLWNLDPTKWLTVSECCSHILCRGLVRVRCCKLEVPRVLAYLTTRGIINMGLLKPPLGVTVTDSVKKPSVIVIGAGMSGVATARQLQNFGCQVTVLEASNRVGGRVHDETDAGTVISRGAGVVSGCVNNPVSIMCHQADVDLIPMSCKCTLFTADGDKVKSLVDKRMDFHFNALLDIIAERRKDKANVQDTSLLDKIRDMHEQFVEESQLEFTEEESKLLNFHMGTVEFACGCELQNLSALQWDQNEEFPQFKGDLAYLSTGFGSLVEKLADGLDIHLNCQVASVNYSSNKITVSSVGNKEWKCDKVIVSVPLTVLQKHQITFQPSLPAEKLKAVDSLGVGVVDKVILKFSENFWQDHVKAGHNFGRVPETEEDQGLFTVFYDFSQKNKDHYILVSHIHGKALESNKNKTDEELVQICIKLLNGMFGKSKVPAPVSSLVHRWSVTEHINMSYSYIPVGSSGEAYNVIAEEVEEKVYFAGEATSRQHPQTIVGAYLSGVREAAKIMEQL